MKTLSHSLFALIAFAMLGVSPATAAGLLISIDNLNQSGGGGTFEVILTNTEAPGGASYGVAGFTIELNATGTSVTFTAADYPTGTPPYIFDGTGQASLDPTIPLSTDTFSNTHFSGSDIEFTDPSIPVNPGDVFSLALVSFTSTAPVSLSNLQSLLVQAGTGLTDENGNPISYSLPSAAIPEPTSLIMTAMAGVLILGLRRKRRSN